MAVQIVRHDAALRKLVHSRDGGIARNLSIRAIRVQNHAKLNATGRQVAGARNPQGRGPRVDTGRLRSSIAWGIFDDAEGISVRIGTNVLYGYFLETGLKNGATYPFLKPALPAARG